MEKWEYIAFGLILAGAAILGYSAFLTRKIFERIPNQEFRNSWRNLAFLMVLFFFGYLGAAVIVFLGEGILLQFLAGVIFFMGALFVFLVVRTGLATFSALQHANHDLESKVGLRTRELEARNKELQHFAYIVSHDLKGPLRGIESLTSFIEDDFEDNELAEIPSHIETLKGRINRMGMLIEGILDFSKISMTKPQIESIDLNIVLTKLAENLRVENTEISVSSGMPVVNGVKAHYSLIFTHLISNGIQFNDKAQGWVKVNYESKDGQHIFFVEDNGPGISDAFHEKIFIAFQTLQSRDDYESAGVGLSIVKKIVDQLQGKISVESEVGKGTIFTISIPQSVT